MPVEPGRRRVRSASSKARQAAAKELQPVSREKGKVTTTAVQKIEGVEQPPVETHDVLSDREFAPGQHPAFVRISVGGTYSTQPYESLRLDVAITLPCLPSEVQATFDVASDMVAARLGEEELLWLGSKR